MGINRQIMVDNIKRNKAKIATYGIKNIKTTIENSDLNKIKGLGPLSISELFEIGIQNIGRLHLHKEKALARISNPISRVALERYFEAKEMDDKKREEEVGLIRRIRKEDIEKEIEDELDKNIEEDSIEE